LHVEIEDFNDEKIKSIIYNWMIFEPIFYMCCNSKRWLNNYCKPLSFTFEVDDPDFLENITEVMMESKYFAINLCNYKKKKKKTLEVRIMDSDACLYGDIAVNWCKIILCFVERCKNNTEYKNVTDINYGSMEDFTKFMDMDGFFGSDKIRLWLIERVRIIYDMFKDSDDRSIWIWLKIMENYFGETLNA
jgi:hypothetical protein